MASEMWGLGIEGGCTAAYKDKPAKRSNRISYTPQPQLRKANHHNHTQPNHATTTTDKNE
jgi:hypothetical protein